MSKTDTMYIAFTHGGILPKSVTGGAEEQVPPHKAVKVPRTYGQHLVDDKFAYVAEPPATPKKKDAGKPEVAAIEARLAALRKAADAATEQVDKDRLGAEIATAEGELAALAAT